MKAASSAGIAATADAATVEEADDRNVMPDLEGAAEAKDAEPNSAIVTDVGDPIDVLTVQDIGGCTLAVIVPATPATVYHLKEYVSAKCGIQPEFIRILQGGSVLINEDDLVDASQIVTVAIEDSYVDQTNVDQLGYEGPHVRCHELAPLPAGEHLVEFVMDDKGGEQWFGVVQEQEALGWGEFAGCFYYGGHGTGGRLLTKDGTTLKQFAYVGRGDVIGIAIDCDTRVMTFSRNGVVQGAFTLPPGPLYLVTQVDAWRDVVGAPVGLIEF